MSTFNVLLVQPPSLPDPVASFDQTPGGYELFAPPWSLLSLRAYILKHSRHTCEFLDLRLSDDHESTLLTALHALPEPRVLAVNTTSLGLGPAISVFEMSKRRLPEVTTVALGQHPSQFPDLIPSMPRVDFALAGDPEPILRSLLDFMDLPPRLERISGLWADGYSIPTPSWLPELRTLNVPDWSGVFWPAYLSGLSTKVCRAEFRLSRGTPHTPAARYAGEAFVPFRTWGANRLAALIEKSSHLGVTEVVVNDPPAYWTEPRLDEWLNVLTRAHNTLHWTFRMFPACLSEELADRLAYTTCSRVTFVFPTPDLRALENVWCEVKASDLAHSFETLRSFGVAPHAEFWVGGPEYRRGDREKIIQLIRDLDYCRFTLRPHPFKLDSPLYAEFAENQDTPKLSQWAEWARDPWIRERPVPAWGGAAGRIHTAREISSIQRAIQHSPKRLLRRIVSAVRIRSWIGELERRSSGMMPPR